MGRQLVETIRLHRRDMPKAEAWDMAADWLR
jgi:hypothetical protein